MKEEKAKGRLSKFVHSAGSNGGPPGQKVSLLLFSHFWKWKKIEQYSNRILTHILSRQPGLTVWSAVLGDSSENRTHNGGCLVMIFLVLQPNSTLKHVFKSIRQETGNRILITIRSALSSLTVCLQFRKRLAWLTALLQTPLLWLVVAAAPQRL